MKSLIFIHFALLLQLLPAGTGNARGMADSAGGQVLRLTLSETVELAGKGNFDLRIAEFEKDQADADFVKSSSVFLPRIRASETFVSTDDPLSVFGLKLKQERVSPADFDPALLNNPPSFRNFTTKLEVLQPLINIDGFFGRHAAAKAAGAADAKQQRTRHGTELAVKTAYFGLVLSIRSLDVVSASLAAATAYRDQARDFFDRGMINRPDYLMAEVRVLELGMKQVESENSIRDAGDHLRTMLGLPDSVRIVPTDTLSPLPVGDLTYDPDLLFTSRSDMAAMRNGIDAASAGLRMQRAAWLPTLNAFASYELNDDRLAGAKGRNWMVGAMVNWTIFSGLDRAGEIRKADAKRSALETEYEKMKANGGREISAAVRGLRSAGLRMDLAARAVEQAAESFRVLSDRYEAGLERTADLLQADAMLLNARLSHLQAVYQHNASVFTLEFLLERKVGS